MKLKKIVVLMLPIVIVVLFFAMPFLISVFPEAINLLYLLPASVFVLAFVGIFYMSNKSAKHQDALKYLKDNNIAVNLNVDEIMAGNFRLFIVCSYNVNGEYYKFLTHYTGDAVEFSNKIKQMGINQIRAWVDLNNPDIFELDMLDLFEKTGCCCTLTYPVNIASNNMEEVNEKVNNMRNLIEVNNR